MLTDTIRQAMNDGKMTGAIFVDLSKAFDAIDHASIINKLPMDFATHPKNGLHHIYLHELNVFLTKEQSRRQRLFIVVSHKDPSLDLGSIL